MAVAPGAARAAEKVAVVAVGTTFINLNPLTHIVSTMRVTNNLLFDGLTRFDDDTYQPKPDLAESWTVSKDGLEYVFKLRRGVVFHDGSPFTAHDVKWSWEVDLPQGQPADRRRVRRPLRADPGLPGVPRRPGGGRSTASRWSTITRCASGSPSPTRRSWSRPR